jgi:hypothetical protein
MLWRRNLAQLVAKRQPSWGHAGGGGGLLRFPFMPVLYRQEAGDEAYYDDVPVSLSPFQNRADFDQ